MALQLRTRLYLPPDEPRSSSIKTRSINHHFLCVLCCHALGGLDCTAVPFLGNGFAQERTEHDR